MHQIGRDSFVRRTSVARRTPAVSIFRIAAMAANGVKRAKLEATLHDSHNVVLVLDYGSQYTQLVCRRIRDIGVFSMMFPGDASMVSPSPSSSSSSGNRGAPPAARHRDSGSRSPAHCAAA